MARRPPGKLGTQVIDVAHDVSGPFFASAVAYATEKLLQLWRASNFGEGQRRLMKLEHSTLHFD
jgi:hypothetical protein